MEQKVHPDLLEYIEKKPKAWRLQAKVYAKAMDNVLPESEKITGTYRSKHALYVLTNDSLYSTNGGKVESIHTKAITSIKQKPAKTTIETSSEKLELHPGYGKFITLDFKGLNEFVKLVRAAS